MRCAICNYSPLTDNKKPWRKRKMYYDTRVEDYHCSVCVAQWNISMLGFEEVRDEDERH